ncbi:MAG: tail fiber domain-containing protein [Chitinophagales bacterium]
MKRIRTLIKLFLVFAIVSISGIKVGLAQENVGIGTLTPNPNAILDLVANDKGFLVPRIDVAQRTALALILNNTTDRGLLTYDPADELFYFWDGTVWIPFPGGGGGTDDQLLAIDVATNLLSIESGNSIDLSPYLDNTDDQVITNFSWDTLTQELTISIENGNSLSVNIPFAGITDTDDQAISISNDTIYLEDGGFVVLPSGSVDTDDQTLTVTNQGAGSVSVQIADGNEVTFNIEDADADSTNELQNLIQLSDSSFVISGTNDTIIINSIAGTDDQIISISNDTIYLEDGGFVVLPSGTVDTDDQTLTVTNQGADSISVQIADGNEVTFNIEDADADSTNELQNLIQLSDSSFVISGTNDTIIINSIAGTDDQIISISNDTIYLEDGGFVVLPSGVVDTDDQAISISNDTIYLEDGGFVVLPSGTVDTDDQTLTVSNQGADSVSVQIADGNEVTFNIEDADADPTNELQDLIQLSDTSFVISGTNDTIVINSPAGTDDQIISISNDTIYLEDGGFVVLPGGVVDTDDQAISISNDTIYLEDGGFVVLPSGTVDTDDQTLTVTNQSSDSVSIQIADGNEVIFNIEDADADPTNELQDLIQLSDTSFVISGTNDTIVINSQAGTDDQIISISNDTIYLEDGGFVVLPGGVVDTDDQAISISNDTIYLEDGGFVVLPSGTVDTDDQTLTVTNQSSDSVSIQIADGNEVTLNIEDADADPTNELQDLIQLSDTSFVISGTNDTIVISSSAGTDDQIISISNDTIYLEDGGFVVLPGGVVDTDDQAISISNDTIYLEDGGFVVLPSGTVDTDDQTLTVTNQSSDSVSIQIADGNEVTFNIEDADADPTNELQDLIQLSDTSFVISGTNDTIVINSPVGTDDQIISISNDTIYLEDGGFVVLPGGVVDTDDQAISISNDTIYLEDGGFVVLPSGTVDTDDQTLTVTNQSSDSVSIQIADGNEVTFNIEDADADPTNELQDLIQLSDTSFVISGTNDTIVINSQAGTDDQIISISNDTIYLEDGGFVVLPGGVVDTDDQAISISNDTIYLEDGGFVVLPSGTVDTDDQTLTVTNQSSDSVSIQIADGNEVTFNIEDADADPTNELQDLIQLSDTSFVITGTNDTIVINSPAGTDDQIISISNDTIYLEDGGFVVLPDLYDHDWYKMGTTNAPDDINDTIWTEGVVVIGTNSGAVIGDTINTALIVDGNILPTVCGAFDLGSLSYKWRQLFVTSVAGFYACSDKSLKRNIKDIGYGLDHILKLEAVKYQWRDSVNLGLNFELGLIAQDVYRIIPDIVHVPDRTIENDVYSISYLEFIPILIQAIQDQQRIIDDQQAKIEGLEVENEKNETFKAELEEMKAENNSLMKRLDTIEEFMRHLKQEAKKE